MILAAGRGQRMRPLTDTLPKPLLAAGGKPLIVWHIERLAQAGFVDIVINHAWLGWKIEAALGNGSRWGVRLHYSAENPALETAGGIHRALPLLGRSPFLVINGDVWCDWPPAQALKHAQRLTAGDDLAWLLLADNPDHHRQGDFHLDGDGRVHESGASYLTFTGIAVHHPRLFDGLVTQQRATPAALAPLLRAAMQQGRVCGTHYNGHWLDVGTPQRLAALDARLRQTPADAAPRPCNASLPTRPQKVHCPG